MSVRIIGKSQSEVDVLLGSMKMVRYKPKDNTDPVRYTYDAATPAFLPDSSPRDIVVIRGSSSKIIKITRIRLTTTQNSNGLNSWYLLKRNTPNELGSGDFVYVNPIPRVLDGSQPGATATFGYFTDNPARDGRLVGLIRSVKLRSPSLSSLLPISETNVIWDCDDYQSSPLILRGPYESIALNFNGASRPAGISVQSHFTWIEE